MRRAFRIPRLVNGGKEISYLGVAYRCNGIPTWVAIILVILDPLQDPAVVKIDEEKLNSWLGKGALPTPTVNSLIKKHCGKAETVADA